MSDHKSITSAIAAVMAEVTSVSKDDQFNGGQTRYAYRGVDRVVKALSAAVRKNGLLILPQAGEPVVTQTTTSNGKPAFHVQVLVTYRILHIGSGDEVTVTAPGESMDSGDKGVSKAMSVAWRTMLLQTFFLPTEEPDPDSENYELGQQVRGGGSPAAQQRLQERDQQEDALRAEWLAAIEGAKGDKEALTRLWKQATAQKLPRAIVQAIEAAGNATA